ncbi:MAG: Cupin 2 conserved barrel domain protein [Acetothermia bacterium 64_32]|nr:MAG: Cupin 2 conserved barrel domain protein [Acetothermia bacterium 64_32]HAF70724.1 DNA-binding protein [Candidatus Acetothermia bacterium]
MQEIGRRVREFRQRKGWTLEELSARCGLSVSFLSQVERGLSSLSISSLQAICQALGIPITHFFAPPSGNSLVLKAGSPRTRIRIEDSQVTYSLLSGPMPERLLEAFIAEFPVGYKHPLVTHPGEEFGYLLEGEVVLRVEEEEFRLQPGDSFHILSTQPHTIYNVGDKPAKLLWVMTHKLLEGGIKTDG